MFFYYLNESGTEKVPLNNALERNRILQDIDMQHCDSSWFLSELFYKNGAGAFK